jgi:prepilin-type N-terminal cleavage/methylation domain-containing protein
MKQKGFTLIELLVVVAIIGILSAIVLASLTSARSRARDAQRESDIHQIQVALELYFTDHGQYPPTATVGPSSPCLSLPPFGSLDCSNDPVGWAGLQAELAGYIPSLPHDPKEDATGWPGMNSGGAAVGNGMPGNYSYGYRVFNSGTCPNQGYMLVYQLENASGPDLGITSCSNVYYEVGGAGASTQVKTTGAKPH